MFASHVVYISKVFEYSEWRVADGDLSSKLHKKEGRDQYRSPPSFTYILPNRHSPFAHLLHPPLPLQDAGQAGDGESLALVGLEAVVESGHHGHQPGDGDQAEQ